MNIVSAASYIFTRNNEGVLCVLAAKRTGNDPRFHGGLYNVPTGLRDAGESIERCGQREVQEEVGLTIPLNQFKLIDTVEWAPSKFGANFLVYLDSGNWEIGDGDGENEKFQWVPLNQVSNFKWMHNMDKTIFSMSKKLNAAITVSENHLRKIVENKVKKVLIKKILNERINID